jgi:hypothetical protein
MTREEREALIERLQAENAEALARIAEREAQLADPLYAAREWQAPPQQQQRRPIERGQLIYKELPIERQLPPYGNEIFTTKQTQALGLAISMLRAELRQAADIDVAALAARLDALESDLAGLDARISALEGASNGNGYQG